MHALAHIEFNAAAGKAEAMVLIGIEPERLNFKDLDPKSPDLASKTSALFQRLADQKLRASLVPSGLPPVVLYVQITMRK